MKQLVLLIMFCLMPLLAYSQRESRPRETQQPPTTTAPRETKPEVNAPRETNPNQGGAPTTTKPKSPRTQGGATTGAAATGAVKGVEQQITGIVVSLEDVLMGKGRKLTPEEAQANLNNKRPMGLMSGDNVYVVINRDFTLATERLVAKAKDEQVTIKGDLYEKGGMKFIRFIDYVNQPAAK